MKHFRFNVRCIDGRLFRHECLHDDPYFEMDIGECEECDGIGCEQVHREAAEKIAGDKIRTKHEFPPIPVRNWDWSATTDNYEPGDPIGTGRTEADAIDDLVAQIEDARE
jgi:hypothetical protein